MSELVPGGNRPLPDGVLTIGVPGPFDLSVLITDDSGKVGGDADFVFYNQPSAPGTRLTDDVITVDPRRLRAGASRITVVVSPADPDTPLGRLPVPSLRLSGPGGELLARFTPPRPDRETVLLLAEIYRRGTGWKVRALGQGYADGLAGVARDFGVDVTDEDPAPPPPAHAPTVQMPAPPMATVQMPTPPMPPVPAARRPGPDGGHGSEGFGALVNAERAWAGAPPVTIDARLVSAAEAHAATMAAQGRLSVESPDGVSVFQRVTIRGYAYLTVAEHLVSGPRSPADFLTYCLKDPHTRRPLRDPAFTDAGIASAVDRRTGDVYWTALWARPLSAEGLRGTVAEVVALTNGHRATAGLRPLADDTRLASAAQAYSTDMAERGFYSHTSPEGLEPWDRARAAGAAHRGIGENIACGQRTAAEVVEGWMNSPGHRANILKPDFTHIGVGFAGGGRAGTYWTQLFGLV
ncbi:CAP domain-containing protein [Streptomyces sp. NPDC048696]|uniref:CAP domain-containing protein n=1 Tax=Streptomyces sp. NPDC048696 TaxID=3365585 RepID=UPI003715C1A3